MKRIDFYSHDGLDMFVSVKEINSTNSIMTSTDGANWTLQTHPTASLFGVCYAPELGLTVAVGANAILTSTNGTTWTSRTSPSAVTWTQICWSPQLNLFLMTAASGTNVATSPDGISWTLRAHGRTQTNWRGCQWLASAGLFAMGTSDSSFGARDGLATSPDGINWTGRTSPFNQTGTQGYQSYRFANTSGIPYFCATSRNDYGCITSSDGINWTWKSDGISAIGGTTGPAYGAGTLVLSVASPTHADRHLVSTTNGNSYVRSTGTNAGGEGITYSPNLGLFVTTDQGPTGHKAMYSSDGMVWSAGNTPSGADTSGLWNAVCAAQVSV